MSTTQTKTAERLALDEEILSLIERKRAETGDETTGASIERAILDRQIHELQEEIYQDPGAIEPLLVKLRRG
jgi:hypothetical protein